MSLEKGALDELRIDRSAAAKNHSLAGLGLVALVLLLVAIVSGWWFTRPKAMEVRTLMVRENPTAGQKTLLNSSGYVTARREATVSSKVTGKVIEVLIEEGMKVLAGQVLARLDDSMSRPTFNWRKRNWTPPGALSLKPEFAWRKPNAAQANDRTRERPDFQPS